MTRLVTERLRFERDGTVTVLSGKVELGQGLSDALTLICSEELDLEPDRIRVCYGDTGATPDDGLTAGSGSMERAGAAVREAARVAHDELMRRAAERIGVPKRRLEARDGVIRPRIRGPVGGPEREYDKGVIGPAPPPRDIGAPAPATDPPATGGGIDYWELLDAAELRGGQTARSHPGAATELPAASGRGATQLTPGPAEAAAAGGSAVGAPASHAERPPDATHRRRARSAGRSTSPPTPPPPNAPHLQRPPAAAPSSEQPPVARTPSAAGAGELPRAPFPEPERRASTRPGAPAGASAPPAAASASRDTAPDSPANRSFDPRQGTWRRVQRVVRGGGNFVHDLRLPGMVHGRVLRPPGYRQRLTGLAADAARAMRGVLAVVVDGSFVAVAAEREEQAAAAHNVLAASARWQRPADTGLPERCHAGPRDASGQTTPVRQRGAHPRGLSDDDGASRLNRPPEPTRPVARSVRPPDLPADGRAASREAPAETDPNLQRESRSPGLPADGRAALHEAVAETNPILRRGAPPDAHAATVTATYSRPFLMHAALGPSAAAALVDRDGRLTIWSHTQGPYELRAALAEALRRPAESIRVIHVDGAGCYGHNGADDVALDAALLALAVPERPVLVKWTREDEHRWEPFGTAMIVTCSAQLDAAGTILSWRHEVRSHAHGTRPRGTPGHSTLLAAWYRAAPLTPPPPRNGSGLTAGPQRNAEPHYDVPSVDLTTHFVPDAPVRVSALRSLGAFANVFAIESFMDELAARRGEDPLAYRLRHLRDERARQVLTEAVRAAPALPARTKHAAHPPAQSANATEASVRGAPGSGLVGRGMAVARYKNLQACVAVVCDLSVDPGSGRIDLLHATIAADAGRIIDRDGLANQLEGGFLQAASWTLKEAVRWDAAAIRSTDWDTYPVLRFSEVPPVTVRLVDRPDLASVGAGEAAQGPTPAAIANAVYAAARIRLRHTPFIPARVMAALSAAGRRAATGTAHARQAARSLRDTEDDETTPPPPPAGGSDQAPGSGRRRSVRETAVEPPRGPHHANRRVAPANG